MTCPRCQHENPASLTFCGKCGTPLERIDPTPRSYADLNAEVESLRRSLTEALDQQTASAEILRVISRSPTDVQPVFDAIVESAVRLCQSRYCMVWSLDGDRLRIAAHYGVSAAGLQELAGRYPALLTATFNSVRCAR